MFSLHPQLEADCTPVGDLALCRVLLLHDANYPWLILVPRRPDIVEIHELSGTDQHTLVDESSMVAGAMKSLFSAHKMNVAALGNMVPQLHLHHIARFREDPAWPGPVWGKLPARAYEPEALEERLSLVREAIGL